MTKEIRAVVIDDNKEVVNNLINHFGKSGNIKVVKNFNDGNEALNFILSSPYDYDLIIMDILLPGLDGIELLEQLKSKKLNKKIIVLTNYKDNNIIAKCSSLGVAYYIIKPFSIISLTKRINDAFEYKTGMFPVVDNLDLEISQILHNLGIPSHIRGYKYIRDGIMIIYNNESVSMITKEVYPEIANKYETTVSRVERSIRHAIEVSWLRGDLSLMEDLFGFSVNCEKAKPTNSEFLSTIADRLKVDKNFGN